jgi:hypothetical protein
MSGRYKRVGGSHPHAAPLVSDERPCQRCGRMVSRNVNRQAADGVRWCRDCRAVGDPWLLERFSQQ